MIQKTKISAGGVYSILFMLHSLTILLPVSNIVSIAGYDAPVAIIIAITLGFIVSGIAILAAPTQNNISMPEWIEKQFGFVIGRIVNTLYFLFFIMLTAVTLRHIYEVVSLIALPIVPQAVAIALFAGPAALAARLGIEVFTRMSQLYLPFSILTFLIIGLSVGPSIEPVKFQPLLIDGPKPILIAAITPAAFLSLIGLGVWLIPYVNKRDDITNPTMWAVLTAGLILLLVTVYSQGLFGYRGVQRLMFPAVTLARSIRLGRVIERFDVILFSTWMLVSFVQSTLFTYLSSRQLAWIGGTKQFRPLVFPVTMLASVLAVAIATSDIELTIFVSEGAFIPYVLIHTLVIPIVLLIVRAIRHLISHASR